MALPLPSVWEVLGATWAVWSALLPVLWPLFALVIGARLLVALLGRTARRRRGRVDYGDDWDDLRRAVYARAGWRCQNCDAGNVELHAHHVVPLSRGGANTLGNLVCLCLHCHELLHPHMRTRGRVRRADATQGCVALFGLLLMGGLGAVLVALLIRGTIATPTADSPAPSTLSRGVPATRAASSSTLPVHVRVSTPAATQDWRVTVVGVEQHEQLPQFSAPPLGIFLVLDVELKNMSGRTLATKAEDFRVLDGDGFSYRTVNQQALTSYAYARGGQQLGGQVPSGVAVRYFLIYDVGPGSDGLQLRFEQDTKPTVALGVTTLPRPLDTYPPIGQPAHTRNWQITVVDVAKEKELNAPIWGKATAVGTLLVVEVELLNIGKENIGTNWGDFEIRAGQFTYKPVNSTWLDYFTQGKGWRGMGGQVPADVVARHFLVFDIAPDATGLQLVFKQDTKPSINLGQ